MKKEPSKEAYNEYVEKVTPKANCFLNSLKAFLVGGAICTVGEIIKKFSMARFHMSEENAAIVVTILLVLSSVLLTGFNLYASIVNFGGAGGLVPITGFANSVCSPAIEYQKEGQVFGIGVKIFTIAGPVILYGIFSSFILGVIYYVLLRMGVI